MIFDEESDSTLVFFMGTRFLLGRQPVLSIFGVVMLKNMKSDTRNHQNQSRKVPNNPQTIFGTWEIILFMIFKNRKIHRQDPGNHLQRPENAGGVSRQKHSP